MPSVLTITACLVTAGLLVRMVIAGFITRNGIFSWPMFTDPSYCFWELVAETPTGPEKVNFWDYTVTVAEIDLTRDRGQQFLDFLREVKSMHVHGRLVILDAQGLHEMRVVDGHLVD